MKAISLLIPLLVIWNCWADGVREANVGKLSGYDYINIITVKGTEVYNTDWDHSSTSYNYNENENKLMTIIYLKGANILSYINEGGFIIRKGISIGCPRTGIGGCSIFSMGFGYVVIPFLDGVQISEPEFTSQKLERNNMEFSFNMLFTDPTLMTAETHEYKIEFWDCLNGQCELNEYDKKTVKRGEAIITVNYTP